MRTRMVFGLLTALVSLTAMAASSEAAQRPNVVLIMTDDQGYGDLGATGNPVIQTPNIDALARRSARLDNFYVSPVCAPTRACLMTGRYNYRTRCIDTYLGRAMMESQEVTIAEILREAGYATGIFGKWHLGECYPLRPQDQGFETALVLRGGGIGQPSDPVGGERKYTDPILFRNGQQEQCKGYCTDIYYDNAQRFIERAAREGRPFFVYLPDNCPHAPFHDVPQAEYEMYKKMDLSNNRFPQDKGHKIGKAIGADTLARIYAMITNIDRNIGRLLSKLDELKLTDNTMVIFMVDNGPNGRRYVAGMKGMKSHVHEGGIHSPFFVQWPAQLKAGEQSDYVAAHIDLLPTLLEACGVKPPAGLKLDGQSVLAALKGKAINRPPRTIFIQSHRGDRPTLYHNFAARGQRWKLLHNSGFGRENFKGPPKFELYDMIEDPLETNDLAAVYPDLVRRMTKEYEVWFEDVSSTRRDNYAPPRIYLGAPQEKTTVLTRQDWRHTQGRPWQRDSVGHWLVYVARQGSYDIHCRFNPGSTAGQAILKIGGDQNTLKLVAGAGSCTFQGVKLERGDGRLEIELTHDGKTRGIHQADVTRR